jgi:hypothetical protein
MMMQGAHWIRRLLIEHDRWADVALLYPDPVSHVEQRLDSINSAGARESGLDAQQIERMQAQMLEAHRREAAMLYAAFLAAGDERTAAQIAEALQREDDSAPARAALVYAALTAGQPRPAHRQWLIEAARDGADVQELRNALEAALAGDA